jgi:predicted metal-dependent phosphoesterase TrpH
MCNIPLLNRVCLESYNDPLAVYETLKRRGMDFVTVTDHDSVGSAESLRRFPDFFLSEEITCTTPSGTEIHVGVYGIEDRHHIELQRRRTDVPALAAYLREQRLFFSINHVFSSLTGRRTARDFELFEDEFPAMETLNGQIPGWNNRSAAELARDWLKAPVGGSDAHTLESLGLTYTEVPRADTIQDYLSGLRLSQGRVEGASGDYLKLTRAILEIGSRLVGDYHWAITLAPLLLIVPFITLGNYFSELFFVSKWSRWLAEDRMPGDPLLEAPDAAE